jgi:hypothetical protein
VYVANIDSIDKLFPCPQVGAHTRDIGAVFAICLVINTFFVVMTYAINEANRIKDPTAEALTIGTSNCYTRLIGKASEYYFFYDLQSKAISIIPAENLFKYGELSISMRKCDEKLQDQSDMSAVLNVSAIKN